MRQTLFHIPRQAFEGALFGFGWLFFLWLAVLAAFVVWNTARKSWGPESRGALAMLLLIGGAIVFILPQILEKDGLAIRGYGVMVMLGVVAGVAIAAHRAARLGLDPDIIYSLAFWMFLAGIAGARLFYIVQKRDQFHSLGQILNFTQGGLVVYGSVIGGLAAGFWFAHRRRLPILALADLIAPSMLVGLAIGRLGCLLNGCCYGGVCSPDWPLGLAFPAGSPPYLSQLALGELHGIRLAEDNQGRPIVSQVVAGSAAERAGLKPGTIVAAIRLPPLESLEAANGDLHLAGQPLSLVVARRSTRQPINLTLRPSRSPGKSGNDLGMEFVAEGENAALVRKVAPGGPAEEAGLRVGDRIVAAKLPEVRSLEAAAERLQFAGREIGVVSPNGEAYVWSVSKRPTHSLEVHPTQIYSSLGAGALAFFLWAVYPFRRRDGEVFTWMITLYPIGRFLIEIIRDDEAGQWGTPLTISQLISIVIGLFALAFWFFLRSRPRRLAWPANPDAVTQT